jgi:hypothetical protein
MLGSVVFDLFLCRIGDAPDMSIVTAGRRCKYQVAGWLEHHHQNPSEIPLQSAVTNRRA